MDTCRKCGKEAAWKNQIAYPGLINTYNKETNVSKTERVTAWNEVSLCPECQFKLLEFLNG